MNAWSGCYVSGRLDENTTRPARRITCAMRAHASKSAGVKIELRGQNTYHEIIFIYAKSEKNPSFIEERPARYVDTRLNDASKIRFMCSATTVYANQVLLVAFFCFLVGYFGPTSAGLALTATNCKSKAVCGQKSTS